MMPYYATQDSKRSSAGQARADNTKADTTTPSDPTRHRADWWARSVIRRSAWGKAASLGIGLAVLLGSVALQTHVTGAETRITEEYTLGAQDKLRIRAHEWRPARDELYEWKALNAEYMVGASGKLSLPVVGEIDVNGLTTEEVARAIGDRMKQRIGLVENPDISVEVTECRPFYVIGQVARPGAFPYRPGLTVIQAVSLAGGMRRADAGTRLEREIILTQSDMILNVTETRALLARKARLEAEIGGRKEITFPTALEQYADQEPVGRLLAQEKALLDARRNSFENQIAGLKQLKQFLEKETVSLKGQIASHNTVIALARKEQDTIGALVQKGLAIQSRKLGLDRNLAQLEGDRLRMETTLAHNQQEISKTTLSIIDLNARRDIEIATDLRTTQARLDELLPRFETSKLLLQESEQTVPIQAVANLVGRSEPAYAIMRQQGRTAPSVEFAAEETTPVQPGDTIKVKSPVETNPALGATATSFSRWSNRMGREGTGWAVGGKPLPPPDRQPDPLLRKRPIDNTLQ